LTRSVTNPMVYLVYQPKQEYPAYMIVYIRRHRSISQFILASFGSLGAKVIAAIPLVPFNPLQYIDFSLMEERTKTKRTKEVKTKTYNSKDSLVVTHLTTNLPACGLSTAERTGSPVLHTLWSYVLGLALKGIITSLSSLQETPKFDWTLLIISCFPYNQ
jgi:hypothetical protein